MPLLFIKKMKQSDMYIHLKGLKFFAFHGVLPQENKVGAEYTLNLRLKTDFSRASQTDDLNYTINYAEVFEPNRRPELYHQLCRSVRGRKRRNENPFPAVRACHPAHCRTTVSRFPANHGNQNSLIQTESSHGG